MHRNCVLALALPLMFMLSGCQQSLGPMSPAVSKLVDQAAQAHQQGQLEVARCRLSSAVAIDPDNALPLYNWGVLENEAGHYDVAEQLLQQANQKAPGSSDTLYVLLDSQYKHLSALKSDKKQSPATIDQQRGKALQTAEQFLTVATPQDEGRATVEQLVNDLQP